MRPLTLGAVSYLNTKPLVYGLEARSGLFAVRFDVPAKCASLLHEGAVDLGLIPAIEYLRGEYRIVPGVAIGSDGPIASVAIYSRVPIDRVRTLALDTSSRTSVALTRVLCAERWQIAPTLTPAAPDLTTMLQTSDAALIIGDPALAIDADASGIIKTDLGAEWRALTGLPFVYAMWTGRDAVAGAEHIVALNAARDDGMAHADDIAAAEANGDARRERLVRSYLRDNLKYGLGEAEAAGLRRFHELAVGRGLMPTLRPLRFYDAR